MSLPRVLLIVWLSVALALLFGARGFLHAAHGMADGPERTAALAIGEHLVSVSDRLHLSGPWQAGEAALGRSDTSDAAPLLSVPPHLPPHPKRATQPLAQAAPYATLGPLQPSHISTPPPLPKRHIGLRRPTRGNPLRLLITGDSLPGFLGPDIISALLPTGRVHGWTDTHNGTGLTRPDFVDWSVVAANQMRRYNPEATIVFLGGNDFQNMVMPNGHVLVAGTEAWTREYARRAAVCMRVWTRGQATHRIYWLSMPPARDGGWTADFAHINIALGRAAAAVPGARYVNVLGPITDHGRYADYVSVGGQPTLIRESDGLHLNIAGSQLVANQLVPMLRKDWHLR